MFRSTLKISFPLIFVCCVTAWAGNANDCIQQGRQHMFDKTLSGLRLAYQTFDNCLNDPCCADCNTNRELKFLHAVTHTAMLVIKDDNGSIDSVFEVARQFAIEVLGDYLDNLDISYPLNQHDAYEIPGGAPDANEISHIIDTWMIPEIDGIISELNSINDSPANRFRIFFHPDETGLENDLEVDYGEVLVLKGFLTALKRQLQAEQAYDLYIDANSKLLEKVYGNCLDVNNDILRPYPEFLKVLPTSNFPDVNGKAILAQARQDWIDSINYYFDAFNYIAAENVPPGTDPQEDEFLYIDPNARLDMEVINESLTKLRDSLQNDTILTYPAETTKTYDLYDVNSAPIGQLVLVYDMVLLTLEGGNDIEGDTGTLTFIDGNVVPTPWEVDEHGRGENWIEADLERYSENEWGQGWFEGTLSDDGSSITNGTFEYWGSACGTLNNLSGQLISTEVVDVNVDPNPIFGSSTRYPAPVNPRDLLPEFDHWNGPQPNTVGHGLGDDPTLGGILPDMTQYDWQKTFGLQPGGLIYLDFISPWQITIDGNIMDWGSEQLIFNDISGDTEEGIGGDADDEVNGVDIKNLYMAYDWDSLYGAIKLYDDINNTGHYYYRFFLSYSPDNDDSLHSLNIEVYVDNGIAYGYLYYKDTDDYGWTYWQYITDFTVASGPNAIEFKIPFDDIPDFLPGRFITVSSEGWNSDRDDEEENHTHLRIGGVGTISGTVAYNGFKGDPILVQAYTDLEDPEGSAVATTVITEPGPYTLEGIGFGWQGFIRAFTPLFGFGNPFELGAFQVQTSAPVFMMYDDLDDVDITLNYPFELKKGVLKAGEIDSDTREVDWYYFDAVQGGTYTIDLTPGTAEHVCMALYGRNAEKKLVNWQARQIEWSCPAGGRYYVKVANGFYLPVGGTYQIQMTSNVNCPQADIACADWVGVKDCRVDFYDLAAFVSQWLKTCSEPFWCEQTDFNQSGSVNVSDFAALADEWLQDATP